MVAGIDNTDDSTLQLMLMQMQSKINQADTDGVSGLSKSELSSLTETSGVDGDEFLKTLTEKFDILDTNQDGQLSAEEMVSAKINQKELGPPSGLFLEQAGSSNEAQPSFAAKAMNKINESLNSESGSELKDKITNLASSFVQKLIDTYKDGGINGITSSLSSLI